ncbi:MAG: polyhydroxyalkanoate depolymerase, partial [Burkholderiaceae bacterium]
AHRKFYDEYNAVLDMDADYYLETIATVFQDYKLVNGTWDVKSVDGKIERVKPADITTSALLTVEGELDDISGSGQTEAAHKLCSGIAKTSRHHFEAKGAGHYGIFSGRRWREQVYPEVKAFILSHHVAPQATAKPAAIVLAKPVAAPKLVAAPLAKTIAKPVAKAEVKVATPKVAVKPVAKVSSPQTVSKPVAKPVVKPAVKPAAKPALKAVVEVKTPTPQAKPLSKVKTNWVTPVKK